MNRRLDARAAEALLAGRPDDDQPLLTAVVATLRSASSEVPAPSAALASMLDGDITFESGPAAKAVSWRCRTWALPLQLSLGATAALALVLVAAANNELPGPAQTAVADAVEAFTPLHVPRPVMHPPSPRPAVRTPSTDPAASPDPRGGSNLPTGSTSGEDRRAPDGRDGPAPRPSGTPRTQDPPNAPGGDARRGPDLRDRSSRTRAP